MGPKGLNLSGYASTGAPGLVAAYNFDEISGTTVGDSSGNGHNGTFAMGSPTWTTSGKNAGALSFTSNSRVEIPNSASLELTGALTLEAWVYPTSTGIRPVVAKESGASGFDYVLYAREAGPPKLVVATASESWKEAAAGSNLALSAWTHIAGTYDSSGTKFYVNGVEVASGSSAGAVLAAGGVLSIGGNDTWWEFFRGSIDDVRIYNRALSAAEITTDMNTPVTGGSPPPSDTTAPTVSITTPTSGATVSGMATLTASASDNVGVVGVQLKVNGVDAGPELTMAPYTSTADTNLLPDGVYTITAVARDAAGNTTTSAPVSVTVTNSTGGGSTSDVSVNASSDDARESSSGVISLTMSNSFTSSYPNSGMRFNAVNVPNGATITKATIQFNVETAYTGAASISFWGEATDNASAFTTVTSNVSSRAHTAASVSWAVPDWGTVGAAGAEQLTPDLAAIVQEIVSRPGWVSGNSLMIAGTRLSGTRKANSFDYGAAKAPTLHIEYTTGGGSPPPPPAGDTTAPTVSMTAPTGGSTISGTSSVTASASDNVAVVGVQFKLDGANLGAEDTSAPYNASLNTTSLSNGTHTLTAVARDAAGNTKTATTISVTVSNSSGGGSTAEAPPLSTDSDGDGLADAWEIEYFGNLNQSGSGDSDGDGVSNAAEQANGTSPTVQNGTGYTMQYFYDSATGRVDHTVDAKGATIKFEYDGFGRMVKKCYGVTCTATNAEVTVYNAPVGGGTLLGVVRSHSTPATSVEMATESVLAYDVKGRLASTSLTVEKGTADEQTYVTKLGYNENIDAPNCASYPDGSVVLTETTGSGKNLKAVKYWDYSAAGSCSPGGTPLHEFAYSNYTDDGNVGKIEYMTNGSVINTSTYAYNGWGGVTSAQTVQGGSGAVVENNSYTYSPYLQITKVTDNRASTLVAGTETNRTQVFAYDNQNRLVGAAAGANAGCTGPTCTGSSWSKSYAFGANGNLTNKEGVSMTYDPAAPQRLTGFGAGNNYYYDPNGNVTKKVKGADTWTYLYNANNMLVQADKNGVVMERNTFIGETRVKKDYKPNDSTKRIRTYYLGGAFEVRVKQSDASRSHTVYIAGPSGKLASITRDAGTNPAYLAMVSSYTNYALAGMVGYGSVSGLASKIYHNVMGFVTSPTGAMVYAWSLVLAAVSLVVLLLSLLRAAYGWTMRAVGRLAEDHALQPVWNLQMARFSAMACTALVTFNAVFIGCLDRVSPQSELVAATLKFAADGHTIIGLRNALTGETTGGPPPGTYFMLNNHIGSNSVIVHGADQAGATAGTVASLVNYFPYGDIDHAHSPGADVVTLKFAGQELDAETGLYNFGARMYDTDTGRFLAADTITPGGGMDSQGLNRYMYVRGNPVHYDDPTGHDWRDTKAGKKLIAEKERRRKEKLAGERRRFFRACGVSGDCGVVKGADGKDRWDPNGRQINAAIPKANLESEANPYDNYNNDNFNDSWVGPMPQVPAAPTVTSGGGWQATGARGEGFVVPAAGSGGGAGYGLLVPVGGVALQKGTQWGAGAVADWAFGGTNLARWSGQALGGYPGESAAIARLLNPYAYMGKAGTPTANLFARSEALAKTVDAAGYAAKGYSGTGTVTDVTRGATSNMYTVEGKAVRVGRFLGGALTRLNVAVMAYQLGNIPQTCQVCNEYDAAQRRASDAAASDAFLQGPMPSHIPPMQPLLGTGPNSAGCGIPMQCAAP